MKAISVILFIAFLLRIGCKSQEKTQSSSIKLASHKVDKFKTEIDSVIQAIDMCFTDFIIILVRF